MTRITTSDIPGVPGYDLNQQTQWPWIWPGNLAINAANCAAGKTHGDAPLGSVYMLVTAGSVAWYLKVANNKAAADWQVVLRVGASVTGDLTLSGTVTAGDFVTP
jgi:hypothetical protein